MTRSKAVATLCFWSIYFFLFLGHSFQTSADYVIIECSFDEDFCDLTPDIQYGFNWTRHSGPTETEETGPSQDHTSEDGKGYYIYINSPDSEGKNKTARLVSQTINPLGCYKVQFRYRMYGQGIGTLKVNCEPKCDGLQYDSGANSKRWLPAQVYFKVKQEFKFVIEATTTYSVLPPGKGDIAVDDFRVTICPIDCNFTNTICGWDNIDSSQTNRSTYNWAKPGNYTKVFRSNNTGNALFKSALQLQGTYCISLVLDIIGNGNNTLIVKLQEGEGNDREVGSFHRKSDNRQLEISSNVSYQILLDAHVDEGESNNIELYSISSTHGPCQKACDHNNCSNGGTCTETKNGYKCECMDGFTGEHCLFSTSSNAEHTTSKSSLDNSASTKLSTSASSISDTKYSSTDHTTSSVSTIVSAMSDLYLLAHTRLVIHLTLKSVISECMNGFTRKQCLSSTSSNAEYTTSKPSLDYSASAELTSSASSISDTKYSSTDHTTSSVSTIVSENGLSLQNIIIISASGFVFLVLVVVVVVCVCRRKKRRQAANDTKASSKHEPNNDYDMADYSQCATEPANNGEPRKQLHTENEYSVAHDVNIANNSAADGGDIYNHLNQGTVKPIQDENYSHLPAINQNQACAIVDETYSHLANPNSKQTKAAYITETTYSHVPFVNRGDKTATQVGDDDYDALNSALNKPVTGKSKPNIQDSDYDHF